MYGTDPAVWTEAPTGASMSVSVWAYLFEDHIAGMRTDSSIIQAWGVNTDTGWRLLYVRNLLTVSY